MTRPAHGWPTTATACLALASMGLAGAGCGDDDSEDGSGPLELSPDRPMAGEVFELSHPGDLPTSGEWLLTFTEGPAAGHSFVLTQGRAGEEPEVRETEGAHVTPAGAAVTHPRETVTVDLLAPPDATGRGTLCNVSETACSPISVVR